MEPLNNWVFPHKSAHVTMLLMPTIVILEIQNDNVFYVPYLIYNILFAIKKLYVNSDFSMLICASFKK